MNDFRKMMMECNDNLSWCKPLEFNHGDVVIAFDEGDIVGLQVRGETVDIPAVEVIAKLVNEDYDLYQGYSPMEILLDSNYHELPCRMCPWFDICEAMD